VYLIRENQKFVLKSDNGKFLIDVRYRWHGHNIHR